MSVLVKVSTQLIVQIIVLLSILILFRGHNYPGGGFVGALMATTAVGLYNLVFGVRARAFRASAPYVLTLGLICLVLPLCLSAFFNKPMLSALWGDIQIFNAKIPLNTPILFDLGIYLVGFSSLSWLIAELEDKLK